MLAFYKSEEEEVKTPEGGLRESCHGEWQLSGEWPAKGVLLPPFPFLHVIFERLIELIQDKIEAINMLAVFLRISERLRGLEKNKIDATVARQERNSEHHRAALTSSQALDQKKRKKQQSIFFIKPRKYKSLRDF